MKKYIKLVYKQIILFLPSRIATVIHYFFIYKRVLNLSNPTYFSEKMIVIKLSKPRFIDILSSDKITAKELLEKLGFKEYLIPTLYIFENVKKIQMQQNDYPVILKVSNGTSQHVILHNNSEFIENINLINQMMKFKHYTYSKEAVYGYSDRKIIVEPFLSSDTFGLDDYKIHCFNGNPLFIQINLNNSANKTRVMLNQDLEQIDYPFASGSEGKWVPNNQELIFKMMDISNKIASYFTFIRIDFYVVEGKIKIGELTLHPMAGFMLRNSKVLDLEWGKLLKLKNA